jgi:heat shock protein HtpX
MDGFHLRQLLRDARVSRFEEHSFLVGVLSICAALVLAIFNGDLGGSAWALGALGLAVLGLCATSRGVRLYRANVTAALPESVGRAGIRIRPPRIATVTTAMLALVLPAAAAVALVVWVEWGWLLIAGVLLLGGLGLLVGAVRRSREISYAYPPGAESAVLERLCMRADIPVPELIVEADAEPNAWTTRGRIHVTTRLLNRLDESELEAVLAHEIAHLAHRDAAVMDVCSAPSRVLLALAGVLASFLKVWRATFWDLGPLGIPLIVVAGAILSLPLAFMLGWSSRLSVLGMSRSREFAADAAAAVLTGRPSALASALMKLDGERDWLPAADLRQAQARAVLCIVGADRSPLGPLFRTHPSVAARVKRLETIEQRVQAGGRAVSLGD